MNTSRLHGTMQALYLAGLMYSATAPFGCQTAPPPPPANQPPTANAGADQSVEVGASVTLSGAASVDPDGDTLSFAWTQASGTPVTLAGADTAAAGFSAPDQPGTLVIELSVDDGNGGTDVDSVVVTVTESSGNQPPVADAGLDQALAGGGEITLDGAASFDPDGDALIFAWTQIDGPAVTLDDPAAVRPRFTAPNEDTVYVFELSVTAANGGSDSDDITVIIERVGQPRLFIANADGNSILRQDNPTFLNGNITPDGTLSGLQTLLGTPSDIVVNSEGQLIVANFEGNSITTYADAFSANGNVAPSGTVFGPATQILDPTSLTINADQDLLFVAEIFTDRILVFAGTADAAFNGNLAPTRIIATTTGLQLNNPFGINLDASGQLYVANNGGANVLVFANAANLNGNVNPTRTITSPVFESPFDVFIDGEDTLYVVDSFDGEIYIFNDASTLNGAQDPDFTLNVVPAVSLSAIIVDANRTGFIVDQGADAIYIYDDVNTINGSQNPQRTLSGLSTGLNAPLRVFLTE